MASAKLTEFDGHPAVALLAPDGARATILLHGGHLVSWTPAGGDEQLYLSPTSRFGDGASIRGGVPVIFPQFAARGTLPRHGLLRTRPWQVDESLARAKHAQVVMRFAATDETRAIWPHDFEVELTVSVGGKQVDIEFAVVNTGDTPFEFTCALHTYLRTNDVLKAQLEGLQTVKYEDSLTGQWQQQWGDVTRELTLRELGRRVSIVNSGFTDAVVWNPGPEGAAQLTDMPADDWKHMLCVEAARVIEPAVLQPGEEWVGMQTLVAT